MALPVELALVLSNGSIANLSLNDRALCVASTGTDALPKGLKFLQSPHSGRVRTFEYADILNASCDISGGDHKLVIRLLLHSSKEATLPILEGIVPSSHAHLAAEWTRGLMQRAYGSTKPYRRLKVILNPMSGKKLAKKAWERRLRPLFAASGCTVDYEETQYQSHARDIAQSIDTTLFDAVVIVSGDGLIHEFLNGLACRSDALQALQLPIGVIPAGTSNALSCCISGPQKSRNLYQAALTVLKGQAISFDLAVVSQGDKIWYSFLSQAFGIIADADVGTDSWRWMGPSRVIVGFVSSILSGRKYECELWVKNASSDRAAIKGDYFSRRASSAPIVSAETSMAPRHGSIRDDLSQSAGWTKIVNDNVKMIYAGTIPYVDPTFMAFPACSSDGFIDMYLIKHAKRGQMLTSMDGAEKGRQFDSPFADYIKCEAYRLIPKSKKDWLAIDGEVVPCEAIHVECKRAVARCLSLDKAFFAPPEWQPK